MILPQRHSLGCIVFCFTAVYCFTAISDAAVWVSGSNTADQVGVYGTKGVASSSNVPGGRVGSVSWTDADGNLWLFGGDYQYYDSLTSKLITQKFNDLWKCSRQKPAGDFTGDYLVNIDDLQMAADGWLDSYTLADFAILSANWKKQGVYMWTWMSGSNSINDPGYCIIKGTPSPDYRPGSRYGSISWIDSSGNLWLFGGALGVGSHLNDLWKFNPVTGLWTWIGGSVQINQTGVYGTKGIPDALNVPGARKESISWVDGNGNFWLFGGSRGPTSPPDFNPYYHNDLWKYSPSTGLWTWISGSNTSNQSGVYGVKGVPSAANVPGARYGGKGWIDAGNNLWLFGGSGYDSTGAFGYLNDLWKFNVSTGLWTWMSGSGLKGQTGTYGTKGVANVLNMPGARSASVGWKDSGGNFWLFGGVSGYYADNFSDLWRYTPSSGLWTWISGSNLTNQYGLYGTKGIPNSANIPGARDSAVSWFYNNNLWLFGGGGYAANSTGYLNDLWKFTCEGDPGDLNSDCIVNMEDLGILADNWLNDYTLTHFGQVSGNWNRQRNPD
jgi:hypothetical protein